MASTWNAGPLGLSPVMGLLRISEFCSWLNPQYQARSRCSRRNGISCLTFSLSMEETACYLPSISLALRGVVSLPLGLLGGNTYPFSSWLISVYLLQALPQIR